jgi:hypothetical protein
MSIQRQYHHGQAGCIRAISCKADELRSKSGSEGFVRFRNGVSKRYNKGYVEWGEHREMGAHVCEDEMRSSSPENL